MLAIIPARGGSKGVPRKNIRSLAGRPLIDYAIKAALASRHVDRVLVSTEDAEIAAIARTCGADVPFMRPASLATDTVPNGAACLHAIDVIARTEGVAHAAFALIQATAPFISADDIDGAISMFEQRKPPAVVSLNGFETPIEAVFELDDQGRMHSVLRDRYGARIETGTRQSYGQRYVVCGAVTVLRTEPMRIDPNYYYGHPEALGYVIDPDRALDIDTPMDFALAELLVMRRGLSASA
jgi:CMP-N,N'-diacetyllegionaminic acid synthase